MTDMYYVQETIGGWKQTAIFNGTYDECVGYYHKRHLGEGTAVYAIVHEDEYEVDYL